MKDNLFQKRIDACVAIAAGNGAAARFSAPLHLDLVHSVPGRLRLKAISLKGNPRGMIKARRALCEVDGVVAVTANPCTGSLIVAYDTTHLPPGRVMVALAQQGFVVACPGDNVNDPDSRRAENFGHVFARALADALLGRAAEAMIQVLV